MKLDAAGMDFYESRCRGHGFSVEASAAGRNPDGNRCRKHRFLVESDAAGMNFHEDRCAGVGFHENGGSGHAVSRISMPRASESMPQE